MTVARKIPKTDDEIYQELLGALSQIDFGVKGFNEGVRSAYMGVAVELRKLLCDKRPLVNRIPRNPLTILSGMMSTKSSSLDGICPSSPAHSLLMTPMSST